jgi:hypothetical protein
MLQFVEDWILQACTTSTATATKKATQEKPSTADGEAAVNAEENTNESSSKNECTTIHSTVPEDVNLFANMENASEDTVPLPAARKDASLDDDEDEEDYLILSKSSILPTMDKNFQIRQ